MKTRKVLLTILIILACVAAFQWGWFFYRSSKDDPFKISSKRVKGTPDAAVKIIEYTDYRCSFCSGASNWLNKIMRKNPGSIYLEVRYFPLHLNDGALTARFAECALRQNKFWAIHDDLMTQQSKWIRLPNSESFFLDLAVKHRLDVGQLKTCWSDPELYDSIMDLKDQGKDLGVTATPTFFVNGKMAVGVNDLKTELNRLLGTELE
ncbi:MAG: thioredoxin domain-containing protein [Candidatus Omnitrophota bacterium]